jgi:hypothetical protein
MGNHTKRWTVLLRTSVSSEGWHVQWEAVPPREQSDLSSARTLPGGTTCRYGPWPRSGVCGAAAWTPRIGIE